METANVSISNLKKDLKIIKSNFHLNYGKKRIETAKKHKRTLSELGQLTKNVYTGGIFKRVFVEDLKYGIPYISGQHMMNFAPLEVSKIISKKHTPRQEDMLLRKRQILVSCAGTVGNVRLIDSSMEGAIGSQDIIRVVADDQKIAAEYLYAYLSTPTAYNYIQSFIYGSVVPRIEPNTLTRLPVPILDRSNIKFISKLIEESSTSRSQANEEIKKAHEIFDNFLGDLNRNQSAKFFSISKILNNYHKRIDSGYYLCPRPRILGEHSQNSLGLFPILRMSFFRYGNKNDFLKNRKKLLHAAPPDHFRSLDYS